MESLLAGAPRRSPQLVLTRAAFMIVPQLFAVTVAAMYVHPNISSLNSRERQRDMLAQADRQRLVRQLGDLARASRQAEGTGHRRRRAWRTALLLTRLLPWHRAVR
jgi:hypothetical protein